MPNAHHYGFRPWTGNATTGASPQPRALWLPVATGYTAQDDASGFNVDLNIGDPIKRASTGTAQLCNGGEIPLGIVVAVAPYWDGTKMVFGSRLPAGNAWGTNEQRRPWVGYLPVDACLWAIDVDEATTATSYAAYLALVGENVSHTCAGDSATSMAQPRIDISTHAATESLVWRIEQIPRSGKNQDFGTTNVQIVVSANNSQAAGHAATVDVGV